MRKPLWIIVLASLTLLTIPVGHSVTWNIPTQLTTGSITHVQPRISQDGTRITFMANPAPYRTWQIFAINSNGTGIRELTNNTGSNLVPSINGNGTLIVFYSNMLGSYQIYKIRSDGTGFAPITSTPKTVNTYPVISSDGSKVVFESNQTGLMELYSMNLDGTGRLQLTADNGIHEYATITSNGQVIAFDSNSTANGRREVFLVNFNSTGLHQLTTSSGDNYAPIISGNGKFVVFASNSTGHYNIWIIGTDGTGLRRVTFDTVDDQAPAINYDGSRITYTANSTQVMVYDATTGQASQLASSQSGNYSPSIDGSGTIVSFQGTVAGFSQIFLATQVPSTVGGTIRPVDRLLLLVPMLALAIVIGSIALIARHSRKPENENSSMCAECLACQKLPRQTWNS